MRSKFTLTYQGRKPVFALVSDSTWKDKLVSYDGQSITYDSIGNPLTYRDGMTFTWFGRQMQTATVGNTAISYKYNSDGLRAGYILVSLSGKYVIVEKVQHEILESSVKVYNFEVEDFHTYFVCELNVLVHNECGMPIDFFPTGSGRHGAFNQAKRDLGIPTSRQPDLVLPNYDKRGNLIPGKVYVFGDKYIRDDVAGHVFNDGGTLSRHFNTSNGWHYFY